MNNNLHKKEVNIYKWINILLNRFYTKYRLVVLKIKTKEIIITHLKIR